MAVHWLFVMILFLVFGSGTFQDRLHEGLEIGANDEYDDADENITNIISSNNAIMNSTLKSRVTCDEARIKCALRQGCGTALQMYMLDCADILKGRTNRCDEFCKVSLITLTSTEEGESLVNCLCTDNFCKQSKERLEVCRNEVISANSRNAVVSCSVAHLICSSDTSCSTALYYYDKLCRRMFSGRSCSLRCNNSISILGRQKKAEKLSNCICDGTESFACEHIKANMATLCFNQNKEENIQKNEEKTNDIGEERTSPKNGSNAIAFSSSQVCHLLIFGVSLKYFKRNLSNLVRKIITRTYLCLFGLTLSIVVRWMLVTY